MNRLLGVAAIIGGLLKIFLSFVRTAQDQELLETLNTAADAGLLLGLLGIYMMFRDRLSFVGNGGFILALLGLSFVVGPEAAIYGKSASAIGTPVIMTGMALFAVAQLLISGHPKLAPGIVLSSCVVTLLSQTTSIFSLGHIAAGVLFGLGFILYGAYLIRQ